MTRFIGAEPQLGVCDLKAAITFYTRSLGFHLAFEYGEPPFYAQVFRDGARLNLRHVDALMSHGEGEDELLSVTFTVDDVAAVNAEYVEAGVVFAQALRTEPWGAWTFMVRDPDGNLLLFAGAAG